MKVYTATPISNEMRKSLDIKGACSLMKPVPVSQVAEIQRQSDIVVHVEPFALSERYKARLSFSTKIVDYLQSGRCILAIGWEETGGIEYLRNMDAAITITEPSTIKSKLLEIKMIHQLLLIMHRKVTDVVKQITGLSQFGVACTLT